MNIAYGCKNKDDNIRKMSSSGGAFTALAEGILSQGGVVCGAAFIDIYTVEHICIQSKEELFKLRGSKYVLSNMKNSLMQVKEYLEKKRIVLFIGTPCQIEGLKKYLNKDYCNLYTVDFVCHGVPETCAWHMYLEDLKSVHKNKIVENFQPIFRDKEKGWYNYQIRISFENGRQLLETKKKNAYLKAFLNDYILLPACYSCNNKGENRKSDITLADFWGIDILDREFYDNLGVSLVIINSEKGETLFHMTEKELECRQYNLQDALMENPSYYKSALKPKDYYEFRKQITNGSFIKEVNSKFKEKESMLKWMYNVVKSLIGIEKN